MRVDAFAYNPAFISILKKTGKFLKKVEGKGATIVNQHFLPFPICFPFCQQSSLSFENKINFSTSNAFDIASSEFLCCPVKCSLKKNQHRHFALGRSQRQSEYTTLVRMTVRCLYVLKLLSLLVVNKSDGHVINAMSCARKSRALGGNGQFYFDSASGLCRLVPHDASFGGNWKPCKVRCCFSLYLLRKKDN